jgi:hypothetical protein
MESVKEEEEEEITWEKVVLSWVPKKYFKHNQFMYCVSGFMMLVSKLK